VPINRQRCHLSGPKRCSGKPSHLYPTAAEAALTAFEVGPWGQKYAAIGPSWRRAWTEVVPFYAFPADVRRMLYTTNAIEALNAKLRSAVRTRGHFPTDEAALKLLQGNRVKESVPILAREVGLSSRCVLVYYVTVILLQPCSSPQHTLGRKERASPDCPVSA
jgi:hypothetical protein